MKKLTILLLLFTVFAFAEWDVDPDYSKLTADSINAGKLVGGQFWILGDTLFFTDGGADTSFIIQTGSTLAFYSDNTFEFTKNVALSTNASLYIGSDAAGLYNAGRFTTIGYDADDSLLCLIFGATDTLKWDSIPEAFTLTAPLTVGGDLTVSGDIKSGIITKQIMPLRGDTPFLQFAKNVEGNKYFNMGTMLSDDSLTLDSMLVVYNMDDDTNMVTTTLLDIYTDMTGRPVAEIWTTATDVGVDSSGYFDYKYTGINTKIAIWNTYRFGFVGDQMAAANDIKIYGVLMWLSY